MQRKLKPENSVELLEVFRELMEHIGTLGWTPEIKGYVWFKLEEAIIDAFKPKIETYKITWNDIDQALSQLQSLGIRVEVQHSDTEYYGVDVPTAITLAKMFPGRFRPWQREKYDCDDYAREFKAWMAKFGVTSVAGAEGYTPLGYHAFNLMFFKSRGTCFPMFVEPQLSKLWNTKKMSKLHYLPRKLLL